MIELAQLEATISMLGEPLIGFQMTGEVAAPLGNSAQEFAPHGNYPCLGDDDWVSIAVGTEAEWQGFCRALGGPAWTFEPSFQDKASRVMNSHALDQYVAEWTRQRDAGEISGLLQSHGVAAMPVLNIEGQFLDPHLRERGAYVEVEHSRVGVEWLYGVPWLLSDTPGSVREPAPLLGQHNEYVFCQLLGLSQEELEELQSAHAVY